MLKLFGGGKADHPLADPKEARKILDEIPAEPIKALDELGHWMESVAATEGFKPEARAQLLLQIDDAAQPPLRRIARDYLGAERLSKFQEGRLWGAMHGYCQHAAAALSATVELFASGAKGAEALKSLAPTVTVRALRALSQQVKWQYLRYGPFDDGLWGRVARVFAIAEARKFARQAVAAWPGSPESSAEQEFLRAVMMSASSPDSLLPTEIELAERLIAHFASSFAMANAQQGDAAYWIDLAASQPPLRLARPPQPSPTLRFISAGRALQEVEDLGRKVKASNAVPSSVPLGASYEPAVVMEVLDHLLLYWSSTPPERRHPRHRVKSRLAVSHGFDGSLGVLGVSGSLDFDVGSAESWIVDNVSAGGFGVLVPQIKGEWLKIGCLLAMQPEGGTNWLLGVVRRFTRDSTQQGSVGVQTVARAMAGASLRIGGGEAEPGIVLDPQCIEGSVEARIILKPGSLLPGQNIEFELNGKQILLLPQGVLEAGDDYEILRCRPMLRDTGE